MDDQEFTIQELTDQTGLPRRTIHFYIQQEIIPPSVGAGLAAHYRREHLVRLKLIPILRQQGLRLDDIRTKFQNSTVSELEALLSSSNSVPRPAQPIAVNPPGSFSLTPQTVNSFSLSLGITVLVPSNHSPEMTEKIKKLCAVFEESLQKLAAK